MINLEINNQVKARFNQKFLVKISQRASQELKIKNKKNVSVALVSRAVMKKLNRDYRGINQPTDVLSFGQAKSQWPVVKESQGYLGEIIICYPVAQQQARQAKISLQQELARLLVHGLLHLTGQHHPTEAKRQKIVKITEKIIGFG